MFGVRNNKFRRLTNNSCSMIAKKNSKTKLARYFTSDNFLQSFGSLKYANLAIFGLFYAQFVQFLHIFESVLRIIYAWPVIAHNEAVFQIELSLANRSY